jgi:hypothetical protein
MRCASHEEVLPPTVTDADDVCVDVDMKMVRFIKLLVTVKTNKQTNKQTNKRRSPSERLTARSTPRFPRCDAWVGGDLLDECDDGRRLGDDCRDTLLEVARAVRDERVDLICACVKQR